MIAELSSRTRRILSLFVALLVALSAGLAVNASRSAQAAPTFKVLAFYNGTWDAAHIDFVKDARAWFPQAAAQYGFSWEATNNWGLLNTANLAQYKVVMFLDDAPPTAQRAAFQQYMQNGGAWLGFHVSAWTDNPSSWSWYYNTFLGTGSFQTNTWGPTRVTMRADNRTHRHPRLPATFPSSISEWYSWSNDLRQNPNIDILASVDPSSFPVGTDPNQSWYGGYYPLVWSNRQYKMLYANFGHNAMNYSTNTGLSSTFDSAAAEPAPDRRAALARRRRHRPPDARPRRPPRPDLAHRLAHGGQPGQRQVRRRPGRRQRERHRHPAVRLQRQRRPAVPVRADQRRLPAGQQPQQQRPGARRDQRVDRRLRADPALVLQRRQQPAVAGRSEGGGYYRLVNRLSGKCLDVPAASTADSVQLVQYTCNGTAAQSFRLVPQS